MWRNTRMVVLTAMCASFYAAVLIPFMVVPIIPGVTHFRPANAMPVVCSFLFGPAAAWGAAIGNLIGDFFAGLGPGDFFGFIGNFLYALAPYRIWRAAGSGDPVPATPAAWVLFVVAVATGSALCAATVGLRLADPRVRPVRRARQRRDREQPRDGARARPAPARGAPSARPARASLARRRHGPAPGDFRGAADARRRARRRRARWSRSAAATSSPRASW